MENQETFSHLPLKFSVKSFFFIAFTGDTFWKIDGPTRESACEVLFERDNDHLSIPSMILDSLIASPLDTRY